LFWVIMLHLVIFTNFGVSKGFEKVFLLF
jgi:hypothetical protein